MLEFKVELKTGLGLRLILTRCCRVFIYFQNFDVVLSIQRQAPYSYLRVALLLALDRHCVYIVIEVVLQDDLFLRGLRGHLWLMEDRRLLRKLVRVCWLLVIMQVVGVDLIGRSSVKIVKL